MDKVAAQFLLWIALSSCVLSCSCVHRNPQSHLDDSCSVNTAWSAARATAGTRIIAAEIITYSDVYIVYAVTTDSKGSVELFSGQDCSTVQQVETTTQAIIAATESTEKAISAGVSQSENVDHPTICTLYSFRDRQLRGKIAYVGGGHKREAAALACESIANLAGRTIFPPTIR